MRHLDLFSGIGGFALAAQWVWGEQHEIVSFCEIDKFCQKVLKKNFGDVPCCEDIRNLTNEWIIANNKSVGLEEQRQTGQKQMEFNGDNNARITTNTVSRRCKQEWFRGGVGEIQENRTHAELQIAESDCIHIDLLTGGFPCQPFSVAGQQRGKDDDRYLWPEMLRVVKEFRPRWIIGENVPGIIDLALDEVCASLEMECYEVQPLIIPACAVNAPHRRDRVWIIAHAIDSPMRRWRGQVGETDGIPELDRPSVCAGQFSRTGKDDSNADNQRLQRRQETRNPGSGRQERKQLALRQNPEWDKDWLEVATRLCTVDDGLSRGLVRPKGWRVNALKAAGNAIVPQVAQVIFQMIKTIEENI